MLSRLSSLFAKRCASRSFSSAQSPALAFKMLRTEGNNLGVYRKYIKGRTQVVTVVKKYKGDEDVLVSHLRQVVGMDYTIEKRVGSIRIKGDHAVPVRRAALCPHAARRTRAMPSALTVLSPALRHR